MTNMDITDTEYLMRTSMQPTEVCKHSDKANEQQQSRGWPYIKPASTVVQQSSAIQRVSHVKYVL